MEIVLGQFFDASMQTQEACHGLFEAIAATDTRLMPSRYGKTEPLRQPFSVDAVSHDWTDAIFWRSKKPTSLGRFWPRNHFHPHDIVYVNVTGTQWANGLVSLQALWAERFSTHFGYVHAVDDAHVKLPEYAARIMPFGQGLAWRDMEKRLPCVAWSMLFGPEYVQKVGREILLTAPVYRVTEGALGIGLQVTESAQLLIDDYASYRQQRDALVRHLGPNVVAPIDH